MASRATQPPAGRGGPPPSKKRKIAYSSSSSSTPSSPERTSAGPMRKIHRTHTQEVALRSDVFRPSPSLRPPPSRQTLLAVEAPSDSESDRNGLREEVKTANKMLAENRDAIKRMSKEMDELLEKMKVLKEIKQMLAENENSLLETGKNDDTYGLGKEKEVEKRLDEVTWKHINLKQELMDILLDEAKDEKDLRKSIMKLFLRY